MAQGSRGCRLARNLLEGPDGMTRLFTTLAITLALAACSSQSTPPTATPNEPEPAEPTRPAETAEAAEAEPADTAEPVTPASPAELLAAEMSAWEAAKPVFTRHCASCHTAGGKKASKKKLHHFDMGRYPFAGHHSKTIGFTIREVLGISGEEPTMPDNKPGSVVGADLAAIEAWTDAWEAAEKSGAHAPAEPDHRHD